MTTTETKIVNLTVAVPPRRVGYERLAIKEKLNSLISQYVPEADGILIKWSDMSVLNKDGVIVDDQPYTFWRVRFTANVFNPLEGKMLKGTVQQISKNYFIARAVESFTATISIPESLADHPTVQVIATETKIYFKYKGCVDGAYRGEIDEECLQLTANLMKQQELEAGSVYDYARDFEY